MNLTEEQLALLVAQKFNEWLLLSGRNVLEEDFDELKEYIAPTIEAAVRDLTRQLHDLTDDETFCGYQRRYQYIKDAHCVPGPAEGCSLCAIADLTRQRDEAQQRWLGGDGGCYYCGKRTNRLAGNPSVWPVYLKD